MKIQMKNVASYRDCATLETDKRVNLIYGINGTGKTQLSNCLKKYPNLENTEFKDCKIDGLTNEKILVFNQDFINENFYTDKQKPIFTLSKSKIDIVKKLERTKEIINKITTKINDFEKNRNNTEDKKKKKLSTIQDLIWKNTYKKYENTIFRNFFKEYTKSKQVLLDYFVTIEPTSNINKTIDDLKQELTEIQDQNAIPLHEIQPLNLKTILDIETKSIFKEAIIGNENSQISELINRLENSDWVNAGQKYIQETNICPFCQQQTIDENFKNELKVYFDKTFTERLEELEKLKQSYENNKNETLSKEHYLKNKFIKENLDKFENIYTELITHLDNNLRAINNKLEKPNNTIELIQSENLINKFNNFIYEINVNIRQYNQNLQNKQQKEDEIKIKFFNIIRNDNNEIFEIYNNSNNEFETELNKIKNDIDRFAMRLKTLKQKETKLQSQTQTPEISKDNINNNLKELGINEFSIDNINIDGESYYKIVRENTTNNNPVFKTLSEGEKTIISFLYFIELCKGTSDKNETNNDKIIVIDDPISSLSNNYVFNIAQFIKAFFIEDDNFKQIFILTHNLYFFHEMIKVLDNKKGEKTEMFRIKRQGENNYSMICKLNKNEILNDYQMLWDIYKNKENYTDLILPNVMRNIIERFFSFLGNDDKKYKTIDNLYKNANYHAFIRFINRKSHSDRINFDETYDISTIDMQNFINAFKEIFKSNETYKEHYEKMTGDILA